MIQPFKETDEVEAKFREVVADTAAQLSNNLTDFYNGAYDAFPLGEILFALNASPLADQVDLETFVQSFRGVHSYFVRPGTFEFYLDICRVVWGDDVEVEFVIPNPGHLQINIGAASIALAEFAARDIVDNAYVYDEVVDEEGNNIAFQVVEGIKEQSEVDALFKELTPAGIFVEATLTIS